MDGGEVFANEYWRINRFLLKITGLWPYQSKATRIIIRFILLFILHTMTIAIMIRAYYECGRNLDIVLENITVFLYFETLILKYVITFSSESNLQILYEQITKDWRLYQDEGEQNVLRESANYGRLLTIGYLGYVIVAAIGFTTFPPMVPVILDIVNPLNETRERVLSFYVEFLIIDYRDHYKKALVHTFLCALTSIMLFATIDSTYSNCVQHVIGLFKIIDYRLRQAFDVVEHQVKSEEADTVIHDYVLSSISLHNKCIECADQLQSTYTLCFFITTGTTLMALSLGTVIVMMSVDNFPNFIRLFFGWTGIIIYLFYVSMPGQRIFDASSDIFYSAYNSGWYGFPLKTQHLIKFMIMRCSRPCRFTAGPLVVLNLETCGVVIKTALSYCTFVKSMS